jgi:hypothetical protein
MIVFLKTFTTFILIYGLIILIDYIGTVDNIHTRVLCIGFSISVFIGLIYELFIY